MCNNRMILVWSDCSTAKEFKRYVRNVTCNNSDKCQIMENTLFLLQYSFFFIQCLVSLQSSDFFIFAHKLTQFGFFHLISCMFACSLSMIRITSSMASDLLTKLVRRRLKTSECILYMNGKKSKCVYCLRWCYGNSNRLTVV